MSEGEGRDFHQTQSPGRVTTIQKRDSDGESSRTRLERGEKVLTRERKEEKERKRGGKSRERERKKRIKSRGTSSLRKNSKPELAMRGELSLRHPLSLSLSVCFCLFSTLRGGREREREKVKIEERKMALSFSWSNGYHFNNFVASLFLFFLFLSLFFLPDFRPISVHFQSHSVGLEKKRRRDIFLHSFSREQKFDVMFLILGKVLFPPIPTV